MGGGACSDSNENDAQNKNLITPSSQTLAAARALIQEYPGIRVFASQTTGQILWVDAHAHPLTSPAPADSAEQALKIVRDWISRHPEAYRIGDPSASVLLETREAQFNASAHTLRFDQLYRGIPLAGQYGLAQFSARGELVSLVTRLTTADAQAAALRASSYIPASGGGLGPQAWHPATGGTLRRMRQSIETEGGQGALRVMRKLRDAETGEVVSSWDETPSDLAAAPTDWYRGRLEHVAALDSRGMALMTPSTYSDRAGDGMLALGFVLGGVHALGETTTVADAGTLPRRDLVPLTPLATRARDWASEPAFEKGLRAAARLALNLETTQRWFADHLGLASWDGQGGGFHASIRGRHDPSAPPQFAAWGFNGLMIVSDGASPTGQYASESLDIVAHEFTHSVIGASAGLEYHDEPGALNESIADFFGKCVQGFGDPVIGREAGAHQRDVLHPEACEAPAGQPDCRQPAKYGEYRILPLEQDHGGVHLNSGIMTRALARAALARGTDPVARLVLETLREGRISPSSNLEEFAAALSARCRMDSRSEALCAEVEGEFLAAQLLSSPL